MPSLRELQRSFSAAAIFGDPTAATELDVIGGALPRTGLAVYRNNVLGNYRKVLAATYPVVKRLVGAAFFDAASDHYVRGHPSTRGDVNRYGGEFGDFLASYHPAGSLTYLPDVARLEWAIDQSNIAADAAALDLEALAAVAARQLADLRMSLHPAVRLLASPFPILHIWQSNQPGYEGDERVDLGEGADRMLVARSEESVGVERIGDAEYAFIGALAAKASLADAAERATRVDPLFDLAAVLRDCVARRIIVGFRVSAIPAGERRT